MTTRRAEIRTPGKSSSDCLNGETPSFVEKIWSQIDHDLIQLKLETRMPGVLAEVPPISPGLCVKYREEHFGGTCEGKLDLVSQLLEVTYLTYREVWKVQGKAETPEFLWTVFLKELVPIVERARGFDDKDLRFSIMASDLAAMTTRRAEIRTPGKSRTRRRGDRRDDATGIGRTQIRNKHCQNFLAMADSATK